MAHRAHRPHNFRALSKPKQVAKHEHKHYWPYIPVLLLVIATFMISLIQPVQRRGVLAYAVEVSSSSLLQATNTQRVSNGAASLQLNQTLSAAAQTKAQDMVARNYWSHNTPEGEEPWKFITNAGYSYSRAGENLAYGFATSDETVTGWMNSQTHRDNLLDTNFTEVGFGFANSENFNNSGPETVVVAMYGKPQVLAVSGNTPPAPETAAPAPAPSPATAQPETTTNTPPAEPASTPVTTDTIVAEPASVAITRVQSLTNGHAPWMVFGVGIATGLALAILLIKHAAQLRHLLRDSERYILHHPLLDTILVSLVLIGTFLSQTTGFIK